jgi:N-hydroxyarylamine O-acetyltransferase
MSNPRRGNFSSYIVEPSLTSEVAPVNTETASSRVKVAHASSFPNWLTLYFHRINLAVPTDTSAETLADIHFAHANAIAYEMLDVFLGIVPSFDMTEISDKLISGRRGGGCTQMNGLLAVVLESIGFSVRRSLSAVSRENGAMNLSTHMVLLVRADDEEWICDVGFGYRGFLYPLRLLHNAQVVQGVHEYRVLRVAELMWGIQYRRGVQWINMYVLRDASYEADEFVVGQFFNAYSPLSPFKNNLVCARPSLQGGRYLVNNVLVSIQDRVRTRRIVRSLWELVEVLEEYFSIELGVADFVSLPVDLFDDLR